MAAIAMIHESRRRLQPQVRDDRAAARQAARNADGTGRQVAIAVEACRVAQTAQLVEGSCYVQD